MKIEIDYYHWWIIVGDVMMIRTSSYYISTELSMIQIIEHLFWNYISSDLSFT